MGGLMGGEWVGGIGGKAGHMGERMCVWWGCWVVGVGCWVTQWDPPEGKMFRVLIREVMAVPTADTWSRPMRFWMEAGVLRARSAAQHSAAVSFHVYRTAPHPRFAPCPAFLQTHACTLTTSDMLLPLSHHSMHQHANTRCASPSPPHPSPLPHFPAQPHLPMRQ